MSTGFGLVNPLYQWLNNAGLPLTNGLVYTYAAGASTPLATYSDLALTVPNPNPLTLDAYGKALMFMQPLNYKIDVKTSGGVSIDGYPVDNIPGSNLPSVLPMATGGTGTSSFTDHTVVVVRLPILGNSGIGTPGQVLTSSGGIGPPDFADLPAIPIKLLRATSGTDTSAAATTLDTIAMTTHLTNLDSLFVLATMVSKTQLTAPPSLYNVTDSIALATSPVNVNSATDNAFEWTARQDPFSATNYITKQTTFDAGNAGVLSQTIAGMASAWTTGWTLGLRHGGVVAGGTLYWSWAVYRINGQ